MPKGKKEKKDDSERWMISYADLLTLLLAFFIVLYSRTHLDVSRIKSIARGMIHAFHGNPAVLINKGHGGSGILSHESAAVPTPRPSPAPVHPMAQSPESAVMKQLSVKAKELNKAEKALQKVLHPLIKSQQVTLSRQPLSLRIRLNAHLLFPNASATLTQPADHLLTQIATVIRTIPASYPVIVQGYTNDQPIHTARFPSNWELSVARAVSVVHLFIKDKVAGEQLSAQGFSHYHPLKSNRTAAGLTENRRVEIVIRSPMAAHLEGRENLPKPGKGSVTLPGGATVKTSHGEAHGKKG